MRAIEWVRKINPKFNKAEWDLMAGGRCLATVYHNGSWFTWDSDGTSGENSRESSVAEAKNEAILSAINQGFADIVLPSKTEVGV